MSQPKFSVKVYFKAIGKSSNVPMGKELEQLFRDSQVEYSQEIQESYQKSIEPVSLTITIIVGFLAKRYVLDPVFNWLELSIESKWKEIFSQRRNPYQPMHITVKIYYGDIEQIIETEADFVTKEYIDEFPVYLRRTLQILNGADHLLQIKRIKFIMDENNIDKVKVVCYGDTNKPNYTIDFDKDRLISLQDETMPPPTLKLDNQDEIMYEIIKRRSQRYSNILRQLQEKYKS